MTKQDLIIKTRQEAILNLERIIEYNLHLHEVANSKEEIIYYNRVVVLAKQYNELTGHFYRREHNG